MTRKRKKHTCQCQHQKKDCNSNCQENIQKTENEKIELNKEFDILKIQYQDSLAIIKNLQLEMKKFEEIAAKSQSQYISCKYDLDSLISRTQKEKKSGEINKLIEIINKIFLPLYENLRKFVENIPTHLQEDKHITGIKLLYHDLIKKLEENNIICLNCIGQESNPHYHEPISTMEVSEEQKGKIIQEFEKGFIYKKDDQEIVIKAAKVIVGV